MDAFEIISSENSVKVCLPSVLDIRVATEMKEALIEALSMGKKLVVDASEVSRLSTPCIQVLVAAAKTMDEEGRAYALFKPSDDFVSAFDDLGLFPVLMKWKIET